ncbi:MAG: toprim domain-containing protein [Rhodospirillales bacterium]
MLAEGIETGLSIALACPEFRVVSTVSLSNLGRIVLPAQVLDVIVAADNDTGNPAAEAALNRAVDRLLAEGRVYAVARSSYGDDFNDGLQG